MEYHSYGGIYGWDDPAKKTPFVAGTVKYCRMDEVSGAILTDGNINATPSWRFYAEAMIYPWLSNVWPRHPNEGLSLAWKDGSVRFMSYANFKEDADGTVWRKY